MADKTQIEWAQATWNVVTGCSRVSRGCGGPDGGGCYAERWAATRLRHHPSRQGLTDRNGRWTGEVRLNTDWIGQPLRWQQPRKIFVAAHGDLFHENVPDAWIDLVFAVMALSQRHVFQVLTKRPERMRDYALGANFRPAHLISSYLVYGEHPSIAITEPDRQLMAQSGMEWHASGSAARLAKLPLPNVWLGTSAEDQPTADERIPPLLETPAAIRWISAEPLLGPVDIGEYLWTMDALGVLPRARPALDWVVAGGESGPGARPMNPAWARSLRNQCIGAETPFFFKQWGGRSSKSGGRELDGRTWDELPAVRRPAGG